tara:strand:- start:7059 stop:7757 length:699 start_codon:yes stop_codon:yes gene_type:complete
MNVRVHPVRFYGIYSSKEDVPHPRSDYDNHRDDGSPLVNGATQKMIDVVRSFNGNKLNVADFGGGNGKMYSTLKRETTKEFDYSIIELPEVAKDLGKEVTYCTSLEQLNNPIDILYSDATVNLTEATAAENIHNFCSVGAEYIVLNRSILFAQYSEKSFYTYEPRRGAYFSFVELGEFESLFQSYGYELVQRTYTQRQKETSESTPVVVFNIEGYPLDCPFVTYYDHIFKKK